MIQALKLAILKTYLAARRLARFIITFNHAALRNRIRQVALKQSSPLSLSELSNRLVLISSYRVAIEERMDIFRVAMNQSLSQVAGSGLCLRVVDASSEQYTSRTKEVLEKIVGINLDFQAKSARLTQAYYDILSSAREPYFCTVFEDQPVYGLTPEFLASAAAFLKDFEGLVDLMPIELVTEYEIDLERKEVRFNPSSLDFLSRGRKPLAVLTYGKCRFAVLPNFHYGFFFNVMVGNCKVYAQKLKWYMEHVSAEKPHFIEKAGMKMRGPVYNYIAVPLDAFMFNLDFAHTEISVRDSDKREELLFQALRDGFVFKSKG